MIFNVKEGQSINAAILKAGSGDTVLVAPGTYFEVIKLNKEGITLQAGGRDVIIDGEKSPDDTTLVSINGSSCVMQGFNVRNSNRTGIGVYSATNVRVENCDISDCYLGGIRVYKDAADTLIQSCSIHNTCLMNADRLIPGGWPFALGCANTKGTEFRNNFVYKNYGEGIGIGQSEDCCAVSNRSHDNYSCLLYINASKRCAAVWNECIAIDPAYFRNLLPASGLAFADEKNGGYADGHEIYGNLFANVNRGINSLWRSAGLRKCLIRWNDIRNPRNECVRFGEGDYSETQVTDNYFTSLNTPLISNSGSGSNFVV